MTVPQEVKLARHAGDLDDNGHDIYGGVTPASAVTIADAGSYFTATDVEAALQELASKDLGYTAHGSLGTTETFSALTGWHSGTFSANCTATLSGATSGLAASMVLELTSDGSSVMTWPGSVVWASGSAPTLSTSAGHVDIILLMTRDGGTTWYGFPAGGSTGSALTVKDEGTPLTTAATSLDFVGAGVTASGTGAGKTITIPGQTFTTPAIVLGTAASAGAASTGIRSDSTIVAFDATAPTTQAFSDSAATGSAAVAARRDHKHGMPAASGTSATDANIWRPLLDGAGAVVTDGSGQAVMAYGPA